MNSAESQRDEWLIDQSLEETFPASDPPSPTFPGSLLGMRYAVQPRSARHSNSTQPWLIAGLLGGALVGLLVMRQRHHG